MNSKQKSQNLHYLEQQEVVSIIKMPKRYHTEKNICAYLFTYCLKSININPCIEQFGTTYTRLIAEISLIKINLILF